MLQLKGVLIPTNHTKFLQHGFIIFFCKRTKQPSSFFQRRKKKKPPKPQFVLCSSSVSLSLQGPGATLQEKQMTDQAWSLKRQFVVHYLLLHCWLKNIQPSCTFLFSTCPLLLLLTSSCTFASQTHLIYWELRAGQHKTLRSFHQSIRSTLSTISLYLWTYWKPPF